MTLRLFHSGPPMDVLHEEYPKQGSIDENAPVRACEEVQINVPVERVWSLLSDPTTWPSLDERIHGIRRLSPVEPDGYFHWANGRSRILSRYAVVEPNRELTWTGAASGVRAVHRHLLEPVAPDQTILRSEESMSAPFLGLFFPSRKLRVTLHRWLHAVKTGAEHS